MGRQQQKLQRALSAMLRLGGNPGQSSEDKTHNHTQISLYSYIIQVCRYVLQAHSLMDAGAS